MLMAGGNAAGQGEVSFLHWNLILAAGSCSRRENLLPWSHGDRQNGQPRNSSSFGRREQIRRPNAAAAKTTEQATQDEKTLLENKRLKRSCEKKNVEYQKKKNNQRGQNV